MDILSGSDSIAEEAFDEHQGSALMAEQRLSTALRLSDTGESRASAKDATRNRIISKHNVNSTNYKSTADIQNAGGSNESHGDLKNYSQRTDTESTNSEDIHPQQNTNQEPYIKACKLLGIAPVSYILKRLDTPEIILIYHGIGARGAQALAQILESNTSIIRLDLSANNINYGGTHLCQSLILNKTLTHLNLSDNKLGKSGSEFSKLLAGNGTLISLVLKGNQFGDKEALDIANGLKHNTTLQVLDLSHNLLGDVGGIVFGQCIASNDGLCELDIGWNTIRSRGMTALFNGLKENSSIISFNVQHNGAGSNGPSISACIAKNSSIIRLNLENCRLDEASMSAVTKGSLQELNLSGNAVNSQNAMNLLKAVSSSKISLFLAKNMRMAAEPLKRIDELAKEKPDLKIIT